MLSDVWALVPHPQSSLDCRNTELFYYHYLFIYIGICEAIEAFSSIEVVLKTVYKVIMIVAHGNKF